MAIGRIRRSARRGLASAVLGWLGVATAAVVLAPSASAAPTAEVRIRDFTPPAASVDAGGTVTFINEIPDKNLVIDALVDVDVRVHTDVVLSLPSGDKPLAPGQRVTERFASTCTGCAITYTYRAVGAPLSQVIGRLPALPARTPFVVQTILPDLPAAPSVNAPALPAVEVPPLPGAEPPVPPAPAPDPVPDGTGATGATGGSGTGATTGGTAVSGGAEYAYQIGGGVQMAPTDSAAAAAFDPARFSAGSDYSMSTGSGGLAGGYDGASVPVFGELAGMDGASLDEESSGEQLATSSAAAQTLPAAALAAVVALATVTAALVRTHQAQRTSRR